MPEALGVLNPVLCGTVSTEKRPVKPYKRGKAKQHEQKHAWLRTSASAQKPGASGAEPESCSPGCGVASCFWSESQSGKSSFPVAFSQYLPAHQPRQEHLTGGGSTRLFSQLQNVQRRNRHNWTKHPFPRAQLQRDLQKSNYPGTSI